MTKGGESVNAKSLQKAVTAGLAGTVVMTVFSFISGYLSVPHFDLHETIVGHFKTGGMIGWVAYFAIGVFFAYLYGAFFKAMLPRHSWQRGFVYALILWGATEVVLMPVFGMGLFSGSIAAAIVAMAGLGLYGATVGYLYEH